MSQKIVLELLRELGGKASKSPLYQQVAHKLMRLQIWGYIQHDRVKGTW
jgi:hypothetical protein